MANGHSRVDLDQDKWTLFTHVILDLRRAAREPWMPRSKLFVLILLGLLVGSKAQAQVTIDMSKLTCDQFLQHKVTNPTFLALWLSGYYAGKRKNPIVDVEKLEGNADRVSAYCDTNRKTVLMQAIEIVLGPGK